MKGRVVKFPWYRNLVMYMRQIFANKQAIVKAQSGEAVHLQNVVADLGMVVKVGKLLVVAPEGYVVNYNYDEKQKLLSFACVLPGGLKRSFNDLRSRNRHLEQGIAHMMNSQAAINRLNKTPAQMTQEGKADLLFAEQSLIRVAYNYSHGNVTKVALDQAVDRYLDQVKRFPNEFFPGGGDAA